MPGFFYEGIAFARRRYLTFLLIPEDGIHGVAFHQLRMKCLVDLTVKKKDRDFCFVYDFKLRHRTALIYLFNLAVSSPILP